MKLAVKAGCGHTYILATSKYSQRFFKDLGFKIIGETKYDDCRKDPRGRPLLGDTREHTSMQTVIFDHTSSV